MPDWFLVICIGVNSFAGCGSVDKIPMTKNECFAALQGVRVDQVNSIAYCKPIPPPVHEPAK